MNEKVPKDLLEKCLVGFIELIGKRKIVIDFSTVPLIINDKVVHEIIFEGKNAEDYFERLKNDKKFKREIEKRANTLLRRLTKYLKDLGYCLDDHTKTRVKEVFKLTYAVTFSIIDDEVKKQVYALLGVRM